MYPGMYGKVAVPAGERDVLLVPAAAVLQVGQLYYVQVVTSSGSERRLVRLGEATRWQGRGTILKSSAGCETESESLSVVNAFAGH